MEFVNIYIFTIIPSYSSSLYLLFSVTQAFSLLGLILFGFLSVWVFFCMMINRNKVEYTIRMDVASEPAQELVVQAPP